MYNLGVGVGVGVVGFFIVEIDNKHFKMEFGIKKIFFTSLN